MNKLAQSERTTWTPKPVGSGDSYVAPEFNGFLFNEMLFNEGVGVGEGGVVPSIGVWRPRAAVTGWRRQGSIGGWSAR